LLSKWLFKLINENGVWQQILHNKYLHSKTLSQVTSKPSDSPFWKGLMKVKEEFFARGSFILGDGASIRFWEDTLLGGTTLAAQYPSLYSVVRHKDQTIAQVLASVPLNIEFRCSLLGARWNRWLHLLHRLIDVQLENHDDEFRWRLTQTGKFTVKSMYIDLLNDNTVYLHKYLWKMKVPLKTKIFMWFVHRKEILNKDNLAKRNWPGSSKCCFCEQNESTDHLFIKCPFAKIIWQIVYMALNITPPVNIAHMFGTWLNGIVKSKKRNIRVGVCAILTAIWHVRNDFIFNKSCFPTFLQVIPLTVHWIHMWSYL
jgi:hypothetical protein